MNIINIIGIFVLAIGAGGCASDSLPSQEGESSPRPKYDVPPQTIYRIDDHRSIVLEDYDKCYGDGYFVDAKANIRTKLWRGNFTNYAGRLIVDDSDEMNIVVPSAANSYCGDRGCNVPLLYSTDGGRTFKAMNYMQSYRPSKASENYSILVAKDGFYVVKTTEYGKGKIDNAVTKYPLAPGIEYGTVTGLPKGYHIEYLSNKPLPPLRTPSGQERFTCDASIRPSNLPKEK
ncbi:hypothetical protein [Herbaspirillum sp. RV1423]|uniref:T6SS immunity protein Tli3 family protein n=1 Tax=Herbaspirillum sp. RV1423 TaxID=1443993 RepID=UPI00055367B3|nr:hypothetical protein [Herbaspirillum sp. RV1423]